MRNSRMRGASRRSTRNDGSFWLSFSDLMSSLLLIIILIMFYIMYQYFEMYEINMAEIARQQYDLDAANTKLEEERTKLSEAEQQMIAQQIRLDAAERGLEDAEAVLASQREELSNAQSELALKEQEIATKEAELATAQTQLNTLSAQLNVQQTQLNQQQTQLNEQQAQLTAQQQVLDTQQAQLEQLVGMKTRIITSLSDAFRAANVSATVDPVSGAIVLKSDVLFASGQYALTQAGKEQIDAFLPIYLDVLFSEEYRDYVAEIIIEGHTDSVGTYIDNLGLSQQRAGAVAAYVLDEDYYIVPSAKRVMLRNVLTANGRSYSDRVYDARGYEDQAASRRVVFKFRLTDDQMIQQMKEILENTDMD